MKMPLRENISYLVPRNPSIQCWDDRVKLPGPRTKNLIQMGLGEIEETVGGKIKVYLRLKPSSSDEHTYTVLNSTTLQTEAPKDSVSYKNVTNGVGKLIHKFTFTSVLEKDITQYDLFKKCVVKSLKKFLNGENYLLMAYGTTSAGKTFTMQGNVDQPGVIPRALDFVFNSIKNNIIPFCRYQPHQYNEFIVFSDEQLKKYNAHKNFILSLDLSKCQRYPDVTTSTVNCNSSSGFSEIYENTTFKEMQTHLTDAESMEIESDAYKYSVWVSMIEIYNEQVYDLLDFRNEKGVRPKLTFRDDEYGNTFVKNLRYVNVSSGHEAFQIFQFGRTNLHFAPTALNHSSSRSHCIFTITVAKFLNYETSSAAIMSRYSFCDLAGMERAKKTLNVKDRLVESKAINTSLSILVKCLTIIKENQNTKEKKLIPYRESKLTKLFREAVTGKEQFSLIVNVTTEPILFDETLNVLKFSALAQKIVPQNVFVKPNFMMRKVNKSRFSQLVTNSSYNCKTINWDDPEATVDDLKVKDEHSSEVAALQDLVEKLQEELSKERQRCKEIESKIRLELTSKFSEILKKQNHNNDMQLEDQRERLEEMYERKERRLIKYFEIVNKIKKRKMEEEDGEGSNDDRDQQKKMEELEKGQEILLAKNEALMQQIQKLTDDHDKAVVECSTLKFTLAERDRVLEELKRTIEAKTSGEGSFVLELRRQLEEYKTKLADHKVLLDEAASDYKELEENNEYLRKECETLEQCLTEQKDTVADQSNEILELQKMLSHKRILIEKLENSNEQLTQQAKEKDASRETNENSLADILKKELQSLREQFNMTSEKLNESRTELETVKMEKSSLEVELDESKNKIAHLEEKLKNLENNHGFIKEEEFKCVVGELNVAKCEIERVLKEKTELEEKYKDLNCEIAILQKEIKDLLSPGKSEKESEYERELVELKSKLDEKTEESRIRERETKLIVEELEAKIEEAELQMKEIPNLQEEIRNLLVQHEAEVNKLKEDNDRLRKQILTVQRVEEHAQMPQETEINVKTEVEIPDLMESLNNNNNNNNNNIIPLYQTDSENENIENKKEKEEIFEEASSQLNSQGSTPDEKRPNVKETELSARKLSKRLENLTIQSKSTRKKVDLLDESVHPSTLKRTARRRKKAEKEEKETVTDKANDKECSSVKKKGKCYKKLFTDNDFDDLTDLNSSPSEQERPRLRPRK